MKPLVLACLLLPLPVSAAETQVDYAQDVKPIFRTHCYSCHGGLKQESGLRLDTASLMRQGGDSGPALVPGTTAQNLVVERITDADPSVRMPPESDPLTQEQIAIIRSWIAQGALSPSEEEAEADPRAHWSFQQPLRPTVPTVRDTSWLRNPIDAFIAADHQRHGLTPLPPAEKHILLRRVYLDLVGLPPTREELNAFLGDRSDHAYERVVDRLLESQHYGERWGRHWMDVWRYSDWYGRRQVNDVRNSYPHIWRWRDWIIQSLNDDKGYDQMICEMLAADELYPQDDTRLPALGFIVRNWFSLNYDTWKQDLVEHTGKAFLALRLNCAHCHDHKYDPITQEEYFRFRAFFEPLEFRHDRVPGGPALTKYIRYKPGSGASLKPIEAGIPRVYDEELAAPTHMYRLGDTRDRMDRPPVTAAAPAFLGGDQLEIQPVHLPPAAWYPALKEFAQHDELAQRISTLATAEEALAKSQSAIQPLQEQLRQAEHELARARLESDRQSPGQGAAEQGAAEQGAAEQESDEVATRLAEVDELKQQLSTAQRDLAVSMTHWEHAVAESTAIKTRVAADKARYKNDGSDADALATQAARAEWAAKLAGERAKLARAEQILAEARATENPDEKAVKQAESDAAAAHKAIEAAEKNPQPATDKYTLLGPQYPKTSTGRRRALAGWITSRDNPLTARVAVNHIWMRHFGRPLVRSVADFGRSGQRPTHPELLDWLAVELMDPSAPTIEQNGGQQPWAMKQIHRLIVTSNTYRMSSRPGSDRHANFQIDKDNVYWWRFDRQRMQAEIVRDSMLHLAGVLDLAIGGHEVDPKQEAESRRRSMYFAIYPEAGGAMRFMTMFDPPNPTDCYRRSETVVPQQALALANSAVALNQGRQLADNLSKVVAAVTDLSASDEQFIGASFEQVLCRPPTVQERQLCLSFLLKQRELYQRVGSKQLETQPSKGVTPAATDPVQRSRESLVRTLLNHNDFVSVH